MGNGKKLFGTDGVRGVANVDPVTSETALKLGRAAAHVSRRARLWPKDMAATRSWSAKTRG